MTVVSAYIFPNVPIRQFNSYLDELQIAIGGYLGSPLTEPWRL